MRSLTPFIALCVLSLTAGSSLAATSGPVRAFVAYKNALPAGIAAELTQLGVSDGLVLPTINAVAVTAPMTVLQTIAKDPRVLGITPQRRLKFHLYSSVAQINARGVEEPETISEPKGPIYERPGVTGAGVTVAIIDTGIFAAHPDLVGRVTAGRNFEFSLEKRESGVIGTTTWDLYVENSGAVALQDDVGHGTHCAGIVGGAGTAASGLDQRGVAPGVNFVAMKIGSPFNGVVEDFGFEANAVAALDYLIRHKLDLGNVRVASNSWGILAEEPSATAPPTGLNPTDFDPMKAVVRAATAAGITLVFSAGNDGGDAATDTVRPVPNGMDEVISVAAACKADHGSCEPGQVTGFSSRGPQVDVTAPGDQVLSTQSPSVLAPIGQALEGDYFGDSPQDQAINRAAYMRLSGTSMAAPHVAGVVALLLQANPLLTPEQVRTILVDTADDMVIEGDAEYKPGFDNASGFGMVNVRKALAAAVRPADAKAQTAASNEGRGLFTGVFNWALLGGLLGFLAARTRRRA